MSLLVPLRACRSLVFLLAVVVLLCQPLSTRALLPEEDGDSCASAAARPSYMHPAPPIASGLPLGFLMDDVEWNPLLDLQIELPSRITVRTSPEFTEVPFPYAPGADLGAGIAYSQPFRLLSAAGVAKLRAAVDRDAPLRAKASERSPMVLRGLAYSSNAVRKYTEDPTLLELFGNMAQTPVGVHPISMNIGHTNVGKEGGGYIDQWHIDSVDYVLVLIISDITDMEGGELQVLNVPDATGSLFDEYKAIGVPEDLVKTVSYMLPGYGIFMQGSKILHRVKGVLKGREPRISLVSSFSSLDVFRNDSTTYHQSAHQDPEDVHPLEFARQKAWRVEGKMRYILDECKFGTDPMHLSMVMAEAAEELMRTSKLLSREENDALSFFVGK